MMQPDLNSRRLAPIGKLRQMRTQQALILVQRQSGVVDGLTKLVLRTTAQINTLEQEVVNQHRLRSEHFNHGHKGSSVHDLTRYEHHIAATRAQIDATKAQLLSQEKELTDAKEQFVKLRAAHARHQVRSEQVNGQIRHYQIRESVTRQQRIETQSDEHRAAQRHLNNRDSGGSK